MTKIFPNALEPLSSPFNRQQFAALSKLCDVEVLATIPWFPGARMFREISAAGRLIRVPDEDQVDGVRVHHPRFFFLPRFGHALSAGFYAASLYSTVKAYRGKIDVLLGSWAYPDGAATVMLGKMLGLPTVVKLHGSDINVVAEMRGPRQILKWTLPKASRVVAVSRALADKAVSLGVSRDRIAIVPNGVDQDLFHVRDRNHARGVIGIKHTGPLFVYVGRLERAKGVFDLARAFEKIPRTDVELVYVGDGSARAELEKLAAPFAGRIKIVGAQPLSDIPLWMAASTAIVLPSHNEGTPNVILEAFACGRPAVATTVGGIPDLITSPELGELVALGDEAALTTALGHAATRSYDPEKIVKIGARGGWEESATKLYRVLREAIA